jgi:hypothetical protein
VGVLGGCSSSGTSATADDGASPNNSSAGSADTPLPVPFAGLLADSEGNKKALHDAEQKAIAKCMTDEGFTYTPFAFVPPEERAQPFGNIEIAAKDGYGLATGEQPVLQNQDDPNLEGLSSTEVQAYMRALGGTPRGPGDAPDPNGTASVPGGPTISFGPDGCASKGRSVVYGDDRRAIELELQVTTLGKRAYDQAVGDEAIENPEFVAALAEWKACMSEQGFDYPAPLKAADALAERYQQDGADLAKLGAEEIETAVADATCVRSTTMFDTVVSLMRKYEEQAANQNESVITAYRQLQAESVQRANELLGGG